MSTNNTQLNAPTVPSGQILPSFSDENGVNWIAGPPAYATTLSNTPGASVFAVVTLTNGLPVQPQTGSTWTVGGTVGVSGTVPISAASLPLPTDAATDATLSTLSGKVTACNTGAVVISAALPAGTNVLGHVIVDSGTMAATQSGTWNIGTVTAVTAITNALPAGTNVIGHVIVDSGSIIANAGTNLNTSALALETGGNLATVATNTGKIPSQGQALAAACMPVVLPAAQITSLTPPTTVSVTQATGTNLHMVVDAGTITTITGITNALPAGTNLLGKVGIDQTTPGTTNAVAATNFPSTVATGHGTAATAIRVELPTDGTGVIGAVTAISNPLPAGTNVIGHVVVDSGAVTANAGTNLNTSLLALEAGNLGTIATNTGRIPAQGQALAAASLPVVLTAIQQAALTPPTTVTVTQATGTNLHAVIDSGTITAVTAITNALPAGTNLLGKVGIDQTTPGTTNAVQLVPGSTGGMSVSSFLSTGAVQTTSVKSSPGVVYALEFFNNSATPVYVRLYNQTTAPASTDGANIVWRGLVPGNTAGAGFVKSWDNGLAFSAGIGMRCTAAIADNDATALTANTVLGNVDFK